MPTNGIDSGADASGEQQMSFFAENAEIGGGGGFVAAPQGVYLCNLADIENYQYNFIRAVGTGGAEEVELLNNSILIDNPLK